ncbi:unnamed protein product [Blepharisma stoltei]|uniref:Uncharacterized protein n=1 Tax=Blepharisma stoltei TaxID=1481888 RepID=A0AAU9JQZ5_9CILI|nr:unnamed protein product [Blepharisma stoltei]
MSSKVQILPELLIEKSLAQKSEASSVHSAIFRPQISVEKLYKSEAKKQPKYIISEPGTISKEESSEAFSIICRPVVPVEKITEIMIQEDIDNIFVVKYSIMPKPRIPIEKYEEDEIRSWVINRDSHSESKPIRQEIPLSAFSSISRPVVPIEMLSKEKIRRHLKEIADTAQYQESSVVYSAISRPQIAIEKLYEEVTRKRKVNKVYIDYSEKSKIKEIVLGSKPISIVEQHSHLREKVPFVTAEHILTPLLKPLIVCEEISAHQAKIILGAQSAISASPDSEILKLQAFFKPNISMQTIYKKPIEIVEATESQSSSEEIPEEEFGAVSFQIEEKSTKLQSEVPENKKPSALSYTVQPLLLIPLEIHYEKPNIEEEEVIISPDVFFFNPIIDDSQEEVYTMATKVATMVEFHEEKAIVKQAESKGDEAKDIKYYEIKPMQKPVISIESVVTVTPKRLLQREISIIEIRENIENKFSLQAIVKPISILEASLSAKNIDISEKDKQILPGAHQTKDKSNLPEIYKESSQKLVVIPLQKPVIVAESYISRHDISASFLSEPQRNPLETEPYIKNIFALKYSIMSKPRISIEIYKENEIRNWVINRDSHSESKPIRQEIPLSAFSSISRPIVPIEMLSKEKIRRHIKEITDTAQYQESSVVYSAISRPQIAIEKLYEEVTKRRKVNKVYIDYAEKGKIQEIVILSKPITIVEQHSHLREKVPFVTAEHILTPLLKPLIVCEEISAHQAKIILGAQSAISASPDSEILKLQAFFKPNISMQTIYKKPIEIVEATESQSSSEEIPEEEFGAVSFQIEEKSTKLQSEVPENKKPSALSYTVQPLLLIPLEIHYEKPNIEEEEVIISPDVFFFNPIIDDSQEEVYTMATKVVTIAEFHEEKAIVKQAESKGDEAKDIKYYEIKPMQKPVISIESVVTVTPKRLLQREISIIEIRENIENKFSLQAIVKPISILEASLSAKNSETSEKDKQILAGAHQTKDKSNLPEISKESSQKLVVIPLQKPVIVAESYIHSHDSSALLTGSQRNPLETEPHPEDLQGSSSISSSGLKIEKATFSISCKGQVFPGFKAGSSLQKSIKISTQTYSGISKPHIQIESFSEEQIRNYIINKHKFVTQKSQQEISYSHSAISRPQILLETLHKEKSRKSKVSYGEQQESEIVEAKVSFAVSAKVQILPELLIEKSLAQKSEASSAHSAVFRPQVSVEKLYESETKKKPKYIISEPGTISKESSITFSALMRPLIVSEEISKASQQEKILSGVESYLAASPDSEIFIMKAINKPIILIQTEDKKPTKIVEVTKETFSISGKAKVKPVFQRDSSLEEIEPTEKPESLSDHSFKSSEQSESDKDSLEFLLPQALIEAVQKYSPLSKPQILIEKHDEDEIRRLAIKKFSSSKSQTIGQEVAFASTSRPVVPIEILSKEKIRRHLKEIVIYSDAAQSQESSIVYSAISRPQIAIEKLYEEVTRRRKVKKVYIDYAESSQVTEIILESKPITIIEQHSYIKGKESFENILSPSAEIESKPAENPINLPKVSKDSLSQSESVHILSAVLRPQIPIETLYKVPRRKYGSEKIISPMDTYESSTLSVLSRPRIPVETLSASSQKKQRSLELSLSTQIESQESFSISSFKPQIPFGEIIKAKLGNLEAIIKVKLMKAFATWKEKVVFNRDSLQEYLVRELSSEKDWPVNEKMDKLVKFLMEISHKRGKLLEVALFEWLEKTKLNSSDPESFRLSSTGSPIVNSPIIQELLESEENKDKNAKMFKLVEFLVGITKRREKFSQIALFEWMEKAHLMDEHLEARKADLEKQFSLEKVIEKIMQNEGEDRPDSKMSKVMNFLVHFQQKRENQSKLALFEWMEKVNLKYERIPERDEETPIQYSVISRPQILLETITEASNRHSWQFEYEFSSLHKIVTLPCLYEEKSSERFIKSPAIQLSTLTKPKVPAEIIIEKLQYQPMPSFSILQKPITLPHHEKSSAISQLSLNAQEAAIEAPMLHLSRLVFSASHKAINLPYLETEKSSEFISLSFTIERKPTVQPECYSFFGETENYIRLKLRNLGSICRYNVMRAFLLWKQNDALNSSGNFKETLVRKLTSEKEKPDEKMDKVVDAFGSISKKREKFAELALFKWLESSKDIDLKPEKEPEFFFGESSISIQDSQGNHFEAFRKVCVPLETYDEKSHRKIVFPYLSSQQYSVVSRPQIPIDVISKAKRAKSAAIEGSFKAYSAISKPQVLLESIVQASYLNYLTVSKPLTIIYIYDEAKKSDGWEDISTPKPSQRITKQARSTLKSRKPLSKAQSLPVSDIPPFYSPITKPITSIEICEEPHEPAWEDLNTKKPTQKITKRPRAALKSRKPMKNISEFHISDRPVIPIEEHAIPTAEQLARMSEKVKDALRCLAHISKDSLSKAFYRWRYVYSEQKESEKAIEYSISTKLKPLILLETLSSKQHHQKDKKLTSSDTKTVKLSPFEKPRVEIATEKVEYVILPQPKRTISAVKPQLSSSTLELSIIKKPLISISNISRCEFQPENKLLTDIEVSEEYQVILPRPSIRRALIKRRKHAPFKKPRFHSISEVEFQPQSKQLQDIFTAEAEIETYEAPQLQESEAPEEPLEEISIPIAIFEQPLYSEIEPSIAENTVQVYTVVSKPRVVLEKRVISVDEGQSSNLEQIIKPKLGNLEAIIKVRLMKTFATWKEKSAFNPESLQEYITREFSSEKEWPVDEKMDKIVEHLTEISRKKDKFVEIAMFEWLEKAKFNSSDPESLRLSSVGSPIAKVISSETDSPRLSTFGSPVIHELLENEENKDKNAKMFKLIECLVGITKKREKFGQMTLFEWIEKSNLLDENQAELAKKFSMEEVIDKIIQNEGEDKPDSKMSKILRFLVESQRKKENHSKLALFEWMEKVNLKFERFPEGMQIQYSAISRPQILLETITEAQKSQTWQYKGEFSAAQKIVTFPYLDTEKSSQIISQSFTIYRKLAVQPECYSFLGETENYIKLKLRNLGSICRYNLMRAFLLWKQNDALNSSIVLKETLVRKLTSEKEKPTDVKMDKVVETLSDISKKRGKFAELALFKWIENSKDLDWKPEKEPEFYYQSGDTSMNITIQDSKVHEYSFSICRRICVPLEVHDTASHRRLLGSLENESMQYAAVTRPQILVEVISSEKKAKIVLSEQPSLYAAYSFITKPLILLESLLEKSDDKEKPIIIPKSQIPLEVASEAKLDSSEQPSLYAAYSFITKPLILLESVSEKSYDKEQPMIISEPQIPLEAASEAKLDSSENPSLFAAYSFIIRPLILLESLSEKSDDKEKPMIVSGPQIPIEMVSKAKLDSSENQILYSAYSFITKPLILLESLLEKSDNKEKPMIISGPQIPIEVAFDEKLVAPGNLSSFEIYSFIIRPIILLESLSEKSDDKEKPMIISIPQIPLEADSVAKLDSSVNQSLYAAYSFITRPLILLESLSEKSDDKEKPMEISGPQIPLEVVSEQKLLAPENLSSFEVHSFIIRPLILLESLSEKSGDKKQPMIIAKSQIPLEVASEAKLDSSEQPILYAAYSFITKPLILLESVSEKSYDKEQPMIISEAKLDSSENPSLYAAYSFITRPLILLESLSEKSHDKEKPIIISRSQIPLEMASAEKLLAPENLSSFEVHSFIIRPLILLESLSEKSDDKEKQIITSRPQIPQDVASDEKLVAPENLSSFEVYSFISKPHIMLESSSEKSEDKEETIIISGPQIPFEVASYEKLVTPENPSLYAAYSFITRPLILLESLSEKSEEKEKPIIISRPQTSLDIALEGKLIASESLSSFEVYSFISKPLILLESLSSRSIDLEKSAQYSAIARPQVSLEVISKEKRAKSALLEKYNDIILSSEQRSYMALAKPIIMFSQIHERKVQSQVMTVLAAAKVIIPLELLSEKTESLDKKVYLPISRPLTIVDMFSEDWEDITPTQKSLVITKKKGPALKSRKPVTKNLQSFSLLKKPLAFIEELEISEKVKDSLRHLNHILKDRISKAFYIWKHNGSSEEFIEEVTTVTWSIERNDPAFKESALARLAFVINQTDAKLLGFAFEKLKYISQTAKAPEFVYTELPSYRVLTIVETYDKHRRANIKAEDDLIELGSVSSLEEAVEERQVYEVLTKPNSFPICIFEQIPIKVEMTVDSEYIVSSIFKPLIMPEILSPKAHQVSDTLIPGETRTIQFVPFEKPRPRITEEKVEIVILPLPRVDRELRKSNTPLDTSKDESSFEKPEASNEIRVLTKPLSPLAKVTRLFFEISDKMTVPIEEDEEYKVVLPKSIIRRPLVKRRKYAPVSKPRFETSSQVTIQPAQKVIQDILIVEGADTQEVGYVTEDTHRTLQLEIKPEVTEMEFTFEFKEEVPEVVDEYSIEQKAESSVLVVERFEAENKPEVFGAVYEEEVNVYLLDQKVVSSLVNVEKYHYELETKPEVLEAVYRQEISEYLLEQRPTSSLLLIENYHYQIKPQPFITCIEQAIAIEYSLEHKADTSLLLIEQFKSVHSLPRIQPVSKSFTSYLPIQIERKVVIDIEEDEDYSLQSTTKQLVKHTKYVPFGKPRVKSSSNLEILPVRKIVSDILAVEKPSDIITKDSAKELQESVLANPEPTELAVTFEFKPEVADLPNEYYPSEKPAPSMLAVQEFGPPYSLATVYPYNAEKSEYSQIRKNPSSMLLVEDFGHELNLPVTDPIYDQDLLESQEELVYKEIDISSLLSKPLVKDLSSLLDSPEIQSTERITKSLEPEEEFKQVTGRSQAESLGIETHRPASTSRRRVHKVRRIYTKKLRYYPLQKGIKALAQSKIVKPMQEAFDLLKYLLYTSTTPSQQKIEQAPNIEDFTPRAITIQRFARGFLARKRFATMKEVQKVRIVEPRKSSSSMKIRLSKFTLKSRLLTLKKVVHKVLLKSKKECFLRMKRRDASARRRNFYKIQKGTKAIVGICSQRYAEAFENLKKNLLTK